MASPKFFQPDKDDWTNVGFVVLKNRQQTYQHWVAPGGQSIKYDPEIVFRIPRPERPIEKVVRMQKNRERAAYRIKQAKERSGWKGKRYF